MAKLLRLAFLAISYAESDGDEVDFFEDLRNATEITAYRTYMNTFFDYAFTEANVNYVKRNVDKYRNHHKLLSFFS